MNNLVEVGKISRSFGLDGSFKIQSLIEDDSQFNNFTKLIVFGSKEYRKIEKFWTKKGSIYIKLEGINSIEEIERLIGFSIYVDEDDFDYTLKENQFLIEDLIDMNVFIDDKFVGTLKDIYKGPSQDILIITNGKEEAMVPFVREIVKEIDLFNKKINIIEIKGLIPWI